NDYAVLSATQVGGCHDAGASRPSSGQIVGTVRSTNASLINLPPAPTVTTSATGGSIAAGTYKVQLTFMTGSGGETTVSPESTITTVGSTSTIKVTLGTGAQF